MSFTPEAGNFHGYGDIYKGYDVGRYLKDQLEGKRLLQILKEYFLERYGGGYGPQPEKVAELKAKQVLEFPTKRPSGYKPKIRGRREEVLHKALKESVEMGVIEKFKLDDVWHPKHFLDRGEQTTYPFQHTSSIVYTGKGKQIFFSEETCDKLAEDEDFERFFRHKSIFEVGKLKTGNFHGTEGEGWERKAIFCNGVLNSHPKKYARWRSAEHRGQYIYNEGVVLELQVDNRNLIVYDKDPPEKAPEDLRVDTSQWSSGVEMRNLSEIHRVYGSPESFRRKLSQNPKDVEFICSDPVSLSQIKGVWDVEVLNERFTDPHFLSLQDYRKWLYQHYYDYMPNSPSQIQGEKISIARGRVQKELEELVELRNLINNPDSNHDNSIVESLAEIGDEKESLFKFLENGEKDRGFEYVCKYLRSYNQSLSELEDLLTEEFGIESSFGKVNSPKELRDYLKPENMSSILERLDNAVKEIDRLKQKVVKDLKSGEDLENLEKDLEMEEKVERDVIPKLENLRYIPINS